MTPKAILLGAIVWASSIGAAYFLGSKARHSPQPAQMGAEKVSALASVEPMEQPVAVETTETSEPAIQLVALSEEESLEEALDQIESLSEEQTREQLLEAFALPENDFRKNRMVRELLEKLAETAPLDALEMANQIGSMRGIEDARTEILEVWSRNDPVAALAWTNEAMQNEPMRSRIAHLVAVYSGYAQNNPQAAFTSALTLSEETSADRRLRTRALEEIIGEQIENGGLNDARLAVELLEDGPAKDRLLSELVEEWAEFDPQGASAYVEGLTEGASAEVKTSLLGEWAESDPAAAAAWLSAQEQDDAVLGRASAAIIREWTRYDMTASAEWLNSLPESPALDRAVMSYTYRAAQEDPANAMTWAVSINNDWMRNRMMERVASSWRVDDPPAFQAFLDGAELSDDVKERLQKSKDFHGGGRWR